MIALLVLGLYLIATYRRPMFASPDRILAGVWFVLLGTYILFEDDLVPLSGAFIAYFLLFFTAFCVTFQVCRISCVHIPSIRIPKFLDPLHVVVTTLVIGLIPPILAANILTSHSLYSFMDFRLLTGGDGIGERESIRIGIAFPLTCAGWYLARREGYIKLSWLLGLLVFLLSVISTGKIFLLLFLLFLVPWWSPRFNIYRWSYVASAIGLGLFVASHIVLDKFSADPSDGLLTALAHTLKVYALGGVAAFQLILGGDVPLPQRIMWKPVGDLFPGIVRVPESIILPWIQVGDYYTNVYTAFGYWYEAFGVASCILMGSVLGSLYALLYQQRATSSLSVGFVKVFYLFPLLFISHQDFFFPSIAMHVGFLTAAFLLSLTKRKESDGAVRQLTRLSAT